MTINRFCSSGVQAIAIVADRIAVGQIDVGLAGGLESMSMVPMSGAKPLAEPAPGREPARAVHADGHHGGKRRAQVRHHPR